MGFSDEDKISMENLYVKGYGAKKLIKEFLTKAWELRGLKKNFWMLHETGTTAEGSDSIESIQNISRFFLFCNIHTQTEYYSI